MTLRYDGTGTVGIVGAGEVGHGGTIEVNEATGRALLEERPAQWSVQTSAKAPSRPGRNKPDRLMED